MNKTVSIALAGFSFVVEEQAYIKLSDYLKALRNSLGQEEAEEVMYDIEIRIAEIFKGNMGAREVVSIEDVEKVIAQIGTPETIEEQEEAYYSEEMKSTQQKQTYGQKQLFRDPENKKIAGVCSGLAHYVGMDIAIMRWIWLGIFVLGIFSAGISSTLIGILYLIFWMVMPMAETTSDLLKMKGKPVDFDHIKEESLRFANESGKKMGDFYRENKSYITQKGTDIGRIVGKAVAVFCMIIAFKIVLGMILSGLGISGQFNIEGLNELDFLFDENLKYAIFAVVTLGFLLLAFIFIIISLYLFSPKENKTKVRNLGYFTILLFIALVGASIYLGTEVSRREIIYTGTNVEEENLAIPVSDSANVLELDVKRVNIPQNFTAYGHKVFSDKNRVFEREKPEVYITRKSEIETPYLIVRKKADGYNQPIRMNVPVELQNGKLLFPNYINYSYEHRMRDYDVSYELIIPPYMQVKDMSKGGIYLEGEKDTLEEEILDEVYDDDFPLKKGNSVRIETPKDTVIIKRQ